MNALLIIGILLMVGSVAFASSKSTQLTSPSKTNSQIVSVLMVSGLVLVIISAILYLRK